MGSDATLSKRAEAFVAKMMENDWLCGATEHHECGTCVGCVSVALAALDRDAVAVCERALDAISYCVVGWPEGQMPSWAQKLNEVVPDLQHILRIEHGGEVSDETVL